MELDDLPEDLDLQVAWFHALAAAAEEGEVRVEVSLLMRYLDAQLGSHGLEGSESQSELLALVLDLRENERAWNRALQVALLKADDAWHKGKSIAALELLEQFAQDCPWSGFSIVARDQAANYT